MEMIRNAIKNKWQGHLFCAWVERQNGELDIVSLSLRLFVLFACKDT